ncbi:hypothetical protein CSV63_09490 [Sporosarcina sp. P34]|nr:hypothetical protein CSV63_09490 [Sporosarcina sp. P34]PID25214.1 hypothetical protein CSV60_06205 [Sporosarcina sp. P7]
MIAGVFFLLMVGLLVACGSPEVQSGNVSTVRENGDGSVEIKLGVVYATEENLWLIKVASDLAPT